MKRIAAFSGLIMLPALLTGCASGSMVSKFDSSKITNTDPRKDWVEVQPYESKGNTPSYEEGIYMNIATGPATSIATIPDSPECVG